MQCIIYQPSGLSLVLKMGIIETLYCEKKKRMSCPNCRLIPVRRRIKMSYQHGLCFSNPVQHTYRDLPTTPECSSMMTRVCPSAMQVSKSFQRHSIQSLVDVPLVLSHGGSRIPQFPGKKPKSKRLIQVVTFLNIVQLS